MEECGKHLSVKAKRNVTSHFPEVEFRLEVMEVNTTVQARSLESFCSVSFYDVQDLSDAQSLMCLPWLQVPAGAPGYSGHKTNNMIT